MNMDELRELIGTRDENAPVKPPTIEEHGKPSDEVLNILAGHDDGNEGEDPLERYQHPLYKGPYIVTPCEVTQFLNTHSTMLDHDIIIEPIPENYGKILWNGSTMTIV